MLEYVVRDGLGTALSPAASSPKTNGDQGQTNGQAHSLAVTNPALDLIEALYDRANFLERTPEDVWELVQETLIRALDSSSMGCHRIDPDVGTRRWVLRIMHAVFLHRKRQKEGSPRSVCVDLLHPRRIDATSAGRERLPTDEIEALLRSMLVRCSTASLEA